jgi:hypothetical protein
LFSYLLIDTCVFAALPNKCYVQLCGVPVPALIKLASFVHDKRPTLASAIASSLLLPSNTSSSAAAAAAVAQGRTLSDTTTKSASAAVAAANASAKLSIPTDTHSAQPHFPHLSLMKLHRAALFYHHSTKPTIGLPSNRKRWTLSDKIDELVCLLCVMCCCCGGGFGGGLRHFESVLCHYQWSEATHGSHFQSQDSNHQTQIQAKATRHCFHCHHCISFKAGANSRYLWFGAFV